jgi:hypothetical protein
MRHQPLEDILNQAAALEASPILSRRERLDRWAEVLGRNSRRLLQPLKFIEFYAPAERKKLRAEQSPIALAFADPVLRAAGLAGDTLGDAQRFFRLSDKEAHFLLCDCHWKGRMTGGGASRRVKAVATGGFLVRLWMASQGD